MSPDRELLELCDAALLGTLTHEQMNRLEERLAGDPGARRFYVEFVQLQVMLERAHADSTDEAPGERRIRLVPQIWITALAACIAVLAGALAFLPRYPAVMLEAVRGTVTVLRNGKNLPAANRQSLHAGDVLRTTADSGARIQWKSEATSLEMGACTEAILTAVTEKKHLTLLSGELVAQVAKQPVGRPMILKTPHGQVEVVGTRFELSARQGKTLIEVFSGCILLANSSRTDSKSVGARQSGEVDAVGKVEIKNLPPTRTIAMGLLAHWPLNEGTGSVAHDVSGNGHSATIQNASWTTNAGQTALVFSPNTQKSLPLGQGAFLRTPELRLPPAFTITLWLRAGSARSALQAVFGNSDFGADGFGLIIHDSTRKTVGSPLSDEETLAFHARDGRRSTGIRSHPLLLASGSWHFIAVKVDQAAGHAEIFFDGKNVCRQSSIVKGFNIKSPLFFGAVSAQRGLPFAGDLRDIRIYERLLDRSEINHLAGQ